MQVEMVKVRLVRRKSTTCEGSPIRRKESLNVNDSARCADLKLEEITIPNPERQSARLLYCDSRWENGMEASELNHAELLLASPRPFRVKSQGKTWLQVLRTMSNGLYIIDFSSTVSSSRASALPSFAARRQSATF